ncbi:T9SS type A sorting domain-containing protein [Flavobacterium agrisoli]|uniref:T9SS type A sorting domain-containing protein n=1 Tax=Flavobacterium agrisoli TaxID=2793066 RepID=A0A934PK64_9FLAO|nr:T9SS type A sorting domain-containing protein [Flavobacterium agrisoli]MBK0368815.1 T9SS type A sorting domain-containing protein [Flavobacterium agrisoli]
METIISSGSNASGSTGSIAYSIGQVFYTYIGEDSNYNVAQGIQHEISALLNTKPEIDKVVTQMFVFPNPTTDYVTLKMDGYELDANNQFYQVFDLQGKLLQQKNIAEGETQIHLDHLSPSVYILVVNRDNKVVETFKIIKK